MDSVIPILSGPKEEMLRRIDEAMELLDISKYKDRNPFDLSGGQMQRMAIASIIAMQPEVIVLDEPTSQLDPQGREEVFQAVQKLSKKGITIFMVEHNMEKIASYSDRVLLLNEGKQIAFDTPQKIFSRDDLELYGVDSPVFTKICRGLGIKNTVTGCYPVTLEEAKDLLIHGKGEM
jgi:energy-coupling factor transport system ATP-binding protein